MDSAGSAGPSAESAGARARAGPARARKCKRPAGVIVVDNDDAEVEVETVRSGVRRSVRRRPAVAAAIPKAVSSVVVRRRHTAKMPATATAKASAHPSDFDLLADAQAPTPEAEYDADTWTDEAEADGRAIIGSQYDSEADDYQDSGFELGSLAATAHCPAHRSRASQARI